MSLTAAVPLPVSVETGSTKVFAWVLDWPGWCRSGRHEDDALVALRETAPRYAVVAEAAGLALPSIGDAPFRIVDRLPGSASTDYGVPHEIAPSDEEPVTDADLERLTALVQAAWSVLDATAAKAPAELRKGPRGGGRDRDKIVLHVLEAEEASAAKVGIRLRAPDPGDAGALAAFRAELLEGIRHPVPDPKGRARRWPTRYAARRVAWHVLDHAWEIQDRAEPAGG